jgi:hypothetical protein
VSIDPSTEQPLAEIARAAAVDVDKAVRAARRAQRRSWGQLSGRERAKYLFRISRILQERSREFAVLESMDSGKPIKESRDVDIPLAANHFWYYAGWADKLDYAFPGKEINVYIDYLKSYDILSKLSSRKGMKTPKMYREDKINKLINYKSESETEETEEIESDKKSGYYEGSEGGSEGGGY